MTNRIEGETMAQRVTSKEKIRGAILGASNRRKNTETFKIGDEEFEVLFIEPSYDERQAGYAMLDFDADGKPKKTSALDTAKIAIVLTAHDVDSGEKLFDFTDMKALGETMPHVVDSLTLPALKMFNGSLADEKKD